MQYAYRISKKGIADIGNRTKSLAKLVGFRNFHEMCKN